MKEYKTTARHFEVFKKECWKWLGDKLEEK